MRLPRLQTISPLFRAQLSSVPRYTIHSQASIQQPAADYDLWTNRVRSGDKVFVGMSGGVDSSVTAHILKQRGLDVEAIFMRNWDTLDERGECPSSRDYRDVQKVCQQLDIKCHEINLVKEYWNTVFSFTLDEYARGRTPNPDVLCNREIKFGVLMKEIGARLGPFQWFATGHYARTVSNGDSTMLYRGLDRRKDQSYYLAAVDSKYFSRTVFPLGRLDKKREVRKLALDAGLVTAEKEESMGICFVGERRRFDEFLAEYLSQRAGDILSDGGKVLGKHSGMFTKTIGQSAGISGWRDKWYIYAKDMANNRMHAVQNRNNPLLHSTVISTGPIHWISGMPSFVTDKSFNVEAQIRYMQDPQPCIVSMQGDGRATVRFRTRQFGVATGQYLVLYSGDFCLGSAVIEHATCESTDQADKMFKA